MGMSLNVAFNKKVAPYGTIGDDHPTLGEGIEQLEKVAEKNKLASLMQFHSMDPEEAAELFDVDPQEAGPLEWFDPKKGLAAVRGLITFLRENPKVIPKGAEVLEDLESIEKELLIASEQKAKFHFAYLD